MPKAVSEGDLPKLRTDAGAQQLGVAFGPPGARVHAGERALRPETDRLEPGPPLRIVIADVDNEAASGVPRQAGAHEGERGLGRSRDDRTQVLEVVAVAPEQERVDRPGVPDPGKARRPFEQPREHRVPYQAGGLLVELDDELEVVAGRRPDARRLLIVARQWRR